MKIELDKIAHALACYGAVLTLALVMPLWVAVVATLVAGAAKEVYDYKNPLTHTADWNDFWADCIGVGIAVVVVLGSGLLIQFVNR